MREILFKAKRLDNGEWVYGIPIKTHIGLFMCFEENPHYCNQYGYMEIDEIVLVDENTLCQYTGLTDKNGNKIWENDVVRYEDDLANMVKEDLIGWNETHAAFTRLHRSKMGLQYLYINEFIASNFEVIGNIFDNPELLENE